MKLRQAFSTVFRKELRELLRDRRSLFWLLAPPILLPGLAILAAVFIGAQTFRLASNGFPIVVENGDQVPGLVQRFEGAESIRVVEPPPEAGGDPFGEAILIISLPENGQDLLDQGKTLNVQLTTRDNSIVTTLGQWDVKAVIQAYEQDLLAERLAVQGLSQEWLNPIRIGAAKRASTEAAVASGEQDSEGGIIATLFLPLAVVTWMLGGGMGLILDTTVGEKERQTIETLLATPASRAGIVLGKMAVVFIASMVVMGLWLSEGLLINGLSSAGPELLGSGALSPGEIAGTVAQETGQVLDLVGALLLLIVPFTLMLNGLVMAWCAYAANYREATLFMALVNLALPAAVLLTMFSFPARVGLPVYAIPFFGSIVAIRDLFGGALSVAGLATNFLSGLVYAGGSIGLAAWIFNRDWGLIRGLQ